MIYTDYFYSGTIYYIDGTTKKEKFFSGFISANKYINTASETLKKIKYNIKHSFNMKYTINHIKIDVFNKI